MAACSSFIYFCNNPVATHSKLRKILVLSQKFQFGWGCNDDFWKKSMFSWLWIGIVTFFALWFEEIKCVWSKPSNFQIHFYIWIKMTMWNSQCFSYMLKTQTQECQARGRTSNGMWLGCFLACFPSFLERKGLFFFPPYEKWCFFSDKSVPFSVWRLLCGRKKFVTQSRCSLLKRFSIGKAFFHRNRVSIGNLQSAVPHDRQCCSPFPSQGWFHTEPALLHIHTSAVVL